LIIGERTVAAARRLPRAGQKRNAQRRALGKAARAAASRMAQP